MQVYAYEITMKEKGTITLENLPFESGEKVEVIIIPRSNSNVSSERYPLRGKALTLKEPTAPIGESDWEATE